MTAPCLACGEPIHEAPEVTHVDFVRGFVTVARYCARQVCRTRREEAAARG